MTVIKKMYVLVTMKYDSMDKLQCIEMCCTMVVVLALRKNGTCFSKLMGGHN